ncbi:MAG: serine/threonine protein kinase [Myxococcales bacterium]|nr:serine/threonine protein kinase [Myxococcales bacterium]
MGGKDVDPHEETTAEPIRPGKMAAGLPIGGYQLISVLGEGGMGVVWSAHDPTLDRLVAIKVLKRSDAAPALRKRLLREARAMARLKHPNVLTVYEVGTEGDRDYIAMELVEGGSLDEWLLRGPTHDDAMRAVLAAGRGLAAAHAAGLVHRDFKPHNILRSKDGRVLVTDFGLARGLGDDSASGTSEEIDAGTAMDMTIRSSSSSARTDSVLDSPLTHTGAMIGTPAYMAPEQFVGGAPDPRTDQFAFCVTAWQALTGARPYTGASLDELRTAASAGISPKIGVDLPPPVRAALVRGLDPDPAKRWPSMGDLLDALDEAVRPKRPWWVIPGLGAVVIGLLIAAVLIARRGGETGPGIAPECAPGADAFAEAWSAQQRTDLGRTLASRGIELSETAFGKLTAPLDSYRERWTQQLATACKAPERIGARQRACLLAARDQAAAIVLVLREGPPQMYARLDLHGMLPDLGGCVGDSPNAPPRPPEDPVLRGKIVRLLARSFATSGAPDFLARYPALEEEARTIGWAPMLPIVQMGIGNELLRRGEYAKARELMRKVLAAPPETRDAKTVAIARFGLLEASFNELEEPASEARPGELHHEIEKQLLYARKEVKLAGDEPSLVAALAGFEARAQAALAQWGKYPRAYDEALALARKAAASYAAAGDLKRSAQMTADVTYILAHRPNPGALDDAMFAGRTAAEALAAANLDPSPSLDGVRAWVELERGEYATAHQLFARHATPASPRGTERSGMVVDAAGKPVRNARVVVWRGTLVGDPKKVVTDPSELDGEETESGNDGTFTVHAETGDAVIAEIANMRSAPALVGDGAIMVKLEPTTLLAGSIDRPELIGVWVAARYAVGEQVFELRVPARKDRSFALGGLPRGAPVIATFGEAAQGQRRVIAGPGATKVTWPLGQAIEVIQRGGGTGTAWVFAGAIDVLRPGGRGSGEAPTVRMMTRAELEQVARTYSDVAWAELRPVGGDDNTDAGRKVYAPGDRHAVISGHHDSVTVCVTRGEDASAPVSCQLDVVKQEIETVPDEGPRGFGVTPVIFADGDRGKPAP